jgi:L-cysteate sulfo-lyase
MHLSRFPRVRLCHSPTPLEPMERLTRLLGGPTLYVKRDDCTGLASGGNKTRKLEFLMADALSAGANTVITVGAVQSNHARRTAAAAKLGLACEILLERRVDTNDPDYERTGNVLLDRLCGANLRLFPSGTDLDAAAEALAQELQRAGRRPYVIPGGGSNPVGALGYVGAGYGMATSEMVEAIRLAARHEGILLDPVYSGKAMAGLIGSVRQGVFTSAQNVVFLHTGGSPALFAYGDVLVDG